MRIETQPAFILHTRNYRDSSLIVEFLTADYGRVSGVVKGVRSTSKSAKQRRGLCQPMLPLLISWSGKSDLKTITSLESRAVSVSLQGERLFSGLYLNELLTRLLQPNDPHSDIYVLYQWALDKLLTKEPIDVVLRHFELRLLDELGYGIDFSTDLSSGENINNDQYYHFIDGQGFVATKEPLTSYDTGAAISGLIKGEYILAIAEGQFTDQTRPIAKYICRQALKLQLGNKPLKSRELFQ